MKNDFKNGLRKTMGEILNLGGGTSVIRFNREIGRLLRIHETDPYAFDDTDEFDLFEEMDELELKCEVDNKITPTDMFHHMEGCNLAELSDFKFHVDLEEMSRFMNLSLVQVALLIIIREIEYWSHKSVCVAQIAKFTYSSQDAILELHNDFRILKMQNLIQTANPTQPLDRQYFTKYMRLHL